MKIKHGKSRFGTIMGMLIIIFLILPVSAVIVAEIELVTEERPYNSDNPRQHADSESFKIPTAGRLTITYQTDPYYNFGGRWGRRDGSDFYLGPTIEHIQIPNLPNLNIEIGEPYKQVDIIEVNTPQDENLFYATLWAPGECVSFQNCYEGTQYASKQKMTIEFESDNRFEPSDCTWSGSWSGAPQYFGEPVILTQSGNAVTGIYPLKYGKIKGTVSGDVLSGKWYEGSNSGPIELTMLSDCKVAGKVSGSGGGEISYKFEFTRP